MPKRDDMSEQEVHEMMEMVREDSRVGSRAVRHLKGELLQILGHYEVPIDIAIAALEAVKMSYVATVMKGNGFIKVKVQEPNRTMKKRDHDEGEAADA